ncbi:MAG: hypothetical protein K0S85_2888 [Pseudomonas orientalis]|nr:hypothetical protein [Pseudomonas orientalis]
MIEAALMGGALLGPWSKWEFVGGTELLSTGLAPEEAAFPSGVQIDDLIVAVMSPRHERVSTKMDTPGWQHWTPGSQDYLCTARYEPGLQAPRWLKDAYNALFVCVLAFRAPGWSSINLESHMAPATPLSITTRMQNELLLCVGLTPNTTKGWAVNMDDAEPVTRLDRVLSPALHISSTNIAFPQVVSGIAVDALSGAERNLILSVS